jgi:hypothetical protein
MVAQRTRPETRDKASIDRSVYGQSRCGIQAGQMARLRQDSARQITKAKEATRSRERRRKGQDVFAGHTQVEVAGHSQPDSSLLSIDLADNEAEEEEVEQKLSQCGQKQLGSQGRFEIGQPREIGQPKEIGQLR